jgi:hypothetical protein
MQPEARRRKPGIWKSPRPRGRFFAAKAVARPKKTLRRAPFKFAAASGVAGGQKKIRVKHNIK